MGYKNVCLGCRKVGNRPFTTARYDEVCSDCRRPTLRLSHRFRPPKKTDLKKWALVKFLLRHGFCYQHIDKTDEITGKKIKVSYPENLRAAKIFIEKYKKWAWETLI